jgi:hypothetical protein
LALQIGLFGSVHCALVQQVPVKHCPSQQTLPAPHWSLVDQAEQVCSMQIGSCGFVQSGLPQQVPVKHCPSQQTLPAPHGFWAEQIVQVCPTQIGLVAGHVSLVQQSPATHCP